MKSVRIVKWIGKYPIYDLKGNLKRYNSVQEDTIKLLNVLIAENNPEVRINGIDALVIVNNLVDKLKIKKFKDRILFEDEEYKIVRHLVETNPNKHWEMNPDMKYAIQEILTPEEV